MPREVAREVIRRAATPPTAEERHDRSRRSSRRPIREPRASLAFTHRHYQAVVSGEKQQTTRRRADPRIEAGTIVRADVIQFADLEITDVIRKRLSEMTEEDAREEGDYTLDEFQDLWRRSYGGWNPDELVTIIRFASPGSLKRSPTPDPSPVCGGSGAGRQRSLPSRTGNVSAEPIVAPPSGRGSGDLAPRPVEFRSR